MIKTFIVVFCAALLPSSLLSQEIEYITPRLIDLGRIREDGIIEQTIWFVNNKEKSVTIDRVRSSCGCTAARLGDKTFPPGDTASVGFSFNPRGYHGTVRKVVTVIFKDGGIPDGKFVVQADVYSDLDVDPRYLNFGAIPMQPDTVLTQWLSLMNNSEKSIAVKKIYTNDDLVRASPDAAEIPAGKEQLIRVDISANRTGRYTFYVHIQTDSPTKPRINVPIFIYIRE
jgi:hypothetical protein